MELVLHQGHGFRGPCDHIVDVAESVICAQESEIVAELPQEPHERCISPGGSRGETGLNYSSRNPNIGISANLNMREGETLNSKNLILHFLCAKEKMRFRKDRFRGFSRAYPNSSSLFSPHEFCMPSRGQAVTQSRR